MTSVNFTNNPAQAIPYPGESTQVQSSQEDQNAPIAVATALPDGCAIVEDPSKLTVEQKLKAIDSLPAGDQLPVYGQLLDTIETVSTDLVTVQQGVGEFAMEFCSTSSAPQRHYAATAAIVPSSSQPGQMNSQMNSKATAELNRIAQGKELTPEELKEAMNKIIAMLDSQMEQEIPVVTSMSEEPVSMFTITAAEYSGIHLAKSLDNGSADNTIATLQAAGKELAGVVSSLEADLGGDSVSSKDHMRNQDRSAAYHVEVKEAETAPSDGLKRILRMMDRL